MANVYARIKKEIEFKDESGTVHKVPVTFEVPQVETFAELPEFYGSEDEVVRRENKAIGRAAIAGPMLALGKTSAKTLADFMAEVEAEVAKAKKYRPEQTDGVSKSKLVDSVKSILANKDKALTMSVADILAALEAGESL